MSAMTLNKAAKHAFPKQEEEQMTNYQRPSAKVAEKYCYLVMPIGVASGDENIGQIRSCRILNLKEKTQNVSKLISCHVAEIFSGRVYIVFVQLMHHSDLNELLQAIVE
jgi:hypothetical protein